MQTTDNPFDGTRMVVLDKVRRQSQCLELVLSKRLREESPAVLENPGHENNNVSQMPRLHPDLHMNLRTGMIVGLYCGTRSGTCEPVSGSFPVSTSCTRVFQTLLFSPGNSTPQDGARTSPAKAARLPETSRLIAARIRAALLPSHFSGTGGFSFLCI